MCGAGDPLKRIIYVDDDPEDRVLFEDALNEVSTGCALSMAVDGIEALQQLTDVGQPMPFMLIIDLNIPRIGFADQFANKIFDIFERLHSKENYEGTGIGLAIVKKIIDIHGGTIHAAGKEGEGATFTISIPTTRQ